MARRKPQKDRGRNARHWWNYNVPRREPWSDEERDDRKANMQMFRAIGVGLILSICGGLGSSWIATQSRLLEIEVDIAGLKAHVMALRREQR